MKISANHPPYDSLSPKYVQLNRSATREQIIDNWTQKDQFPCRVEHNSALYDSTPTGLPFKVSALLLGLLDNNEIFI